MDIIAFEGGKRLPELSKEEIAVFLKRPDTLVWIDIEDPKEEDIAFLASAFSFHPLTLEDAKKSQELPKLEDYEEYLFIVFHKLYDKQDAIECQEVDFFLGKNYFVTVHLDPSTLLKFAKEKFAVKPTPLDRVLHDILDTMVDNYLPLVNKWDDQIDELEELIIKSNSKAVMGRFLALRHKMAHTRKTVAMQRDVITKLHRNEYIPISKKTRNYFGDVYDHIVSFSSELEIHREFLSSLFDVHLSVSNLQTNDISAKMNKTMERLAIVSMIFLPLTFITGMFGMNFSYIPGADSKFGFFVILAAMLLSAHILFVSMKNLTARQK